MSSMKRWAASALCAALAAASVGCGPVWYFDPNFAERLARQENKPLLLYFRSWDSTQHRNMLREVLGNSAVRSELMDTVNAELEFAYFRTIASRYGVQRPQVCVMCRPDGTMVFTPEYVSPVPKPEAFLEWLKRAKAEATPAPPTSEPNPKPGGK